MACHRTSHGHRSADKATQSVTLAFKDFKRGTSLRGLRLVSVTCEAMQEPRTRLHWQKRHVYTSAEAVTAASAWDSSCACNLGVIWPCISSEQPRERHQLKFNQTCFNTCHMRKI